VSIAVRSRYGLSGHARPVALGIGICAAAAATAGAIALTRGAARGQTTALAVTTIVAGCTFVAAGIVAWLRRPTNLTGPLMIVAGFLLFAGSMAQADQSLPFTIGLVLGAVPAAVIAQLMLAFPDGRLHSRWERLAVAAAYIDVIVVQVAMLMFMGFEHLSGCPCPDNLLLVQDNTAVHATLMNGQRALTVATTLGVGVLLARRWRTASRPLRRAVSPLLSAGVVTIVLLVGSLLATDSGVSLGLAVADRIALAAIPVAYLAGLFRARMARASVSDLVVELGRQPAPGRLRAALARALRDPTLELAYWIPESQTYVGLDGQPVEVRAADGRTVTVLDVAGRRVAALVHDAALTESPELLDGVASAAGLALENERLQAELRAQLEKLRDSRARIVEAGDTARRRLERNLHDGAQQRLVALSVALGLAETKLATNPHQAADLLTAARADLAAALEELREIARGLHPAILSRGLAVALEAVAERSPIPVELRVETGQRAPAAVEAAAYYVVSEALTNVARYAHATAATVRVASGNGQLRVEVSDDGIGGAEIVKGSGLEGLRDRVEAIDGRLEIRSRPGSGTHVVAHMPLHPRKAAADTEPGGADRY
jgi:signal transduction histidine kinase